MSTLTIRQLLRRHLTPFFVSVATLTALFGVQQAARQVPQLSARGLPARGIAEVLVLNLPNIVGVTIPMAVFIAVSWVFTRLGSEGVLTSARRERHGVRRLVVPVLCVAAVIGTLTLVSNTQLLPRANARLITVIDGTPRELNDRTMTVGELREAAWRARTATGTEAAARAAAYEVEIQKKFALAAACMILALVGAATAIRFPRGGVRLVVGASVVVFTGYYLSLVAGEVFADRQVISPLVGMWMANAFLLAVVLLWVWRPTRAGSTGDREMLAIGG